MSWRTGGGGGGGAIGGTSGQWSVDASGDLEPASDNAQDVGTESKGVRTVYADTSVVTPKIVTADGFTFVSVASGVRLETEGSAVTYNGDRLAPSNDNTQDLGDDATGGWRTLYADTSVVTPTVGLTPYTVATLPAATTAGQIIYVSDGAAGSPVLAFSNGSNWLRCDTLAAVSGS